MVNLLAGFNGLEAGLGIIYMTSLGLYSYTQENYLASIIALMVLLPLCNFWIYNKYPSKILPGDSLTYFLGGSLATIAILGRMEFITLIISIPFIIEFILKLKSNLKADSFGFYKNGKICSKYKKIYSIPHIFTRKCKYTEKQVVYLTLIIEFFFAVLIWFI
jgi:UDP-N-acetylglucosamine--dolichyl-phosphate N-acetylglucosaminephosphotransferase